MKQALFLSLLLVTFSACNQTSQQPQNIQSDQNTNSQTQTPAPAIDRQTQQDIRSAFATKHPDWDIDNLAIEFTQQQDGFIKGTVKFKDEQGGGLFFAAQTDTGWVIASDGNGVTSCTDIQAFNFPVEIIPECFDPITSQMIER